MSDGVSPEFEAEMNRISQIAALQEKYTRSHGLFSTVGCNEGDLAIMSFIGEKILDIPVEQDQTIVAQLINPQAGIMRVVAGKLQPELVGTEIGIGMITDTSVAGKIVSEVPLRSAFALGRNFQYYDAKKFYQDPNTGYNSSDYKNTALQYAGVVIGKTTFF